MTLDVHMRIYIQQAVARRLELGPADILGTVHDLAQKKTVLSCFAADALRDGPVAQAVLPHALPLGLHGAFVAA